MRIVLALLLLVLAGGAAAQSEPPVIVRTTIRPESGAVIGQRVQVLVDVLFRDGMVRPPRVAIGDVPGAQLVRFESQATTMNERIGGRDWTGQRFEFAFYGRRGGSFTMPAPVATLLDAAGDVTGTVTGQPATLQIAVPPGVDAGQPVIATTRASLEQTWSPAGRTSLAAGDALVRTIVRQAADLSGMAIPDLIFAAPPGVRLYVEPPEVADTQSRGDVTGRRTDRVTYVFETAGTFTLPAVEQPWWDLGSARSRVERGPGLTATVVAAPTPPSSRASAERWVFIAATAAGLLALAAWARPRLRAWSARRRARWLASEASARQELLAACRTGDPQAVYRTFVVWRQRRPARRDLVSMAETIEAVLFAGAPWSAADARAFAGRVGEMSHRAPARRVKEQALPPLNPAA